MHAAQEFDVAIIGGGAAGLMCALTAGQAGLRVVVLEHANRVGKKILMSGGGRCNFTNIGTSPANFISANPHFCKSALARYRPIDFIALVEKHGIAYHEKELGQLFCDDSSKQIVKMLVDECDAAGVQILTSTQVQSIVQTEPDFLLATGAGAFRAGKLVVATGGLSIPAMGATGFGYEIARQFGHTVLPTRAGLVSRPCASSKITKNSGDSRRASGAGRLPAGYKLATGPDSTGQMLRLTRVKWPLVLTRKFCTPARVFAAAARCKHVVNSARSPSRAIFKILLIPESPGVGSRNMPVRPCK